MFEYTPRVKDSHFSCVCVCVLGGSQNGPLVRQVRSPGTTFPALPGSCTPAVLPFAYPDFKWILFLSTFLLQACFLYAVKENCLLNTQGLLCVWQETTHLSHQALRNPVHRKRRLLPITIYVRGHHMLFCGPQEFPDGKHLLSVSGQMKSGLGSGHLYHRKLA